MNGTVKNTNQEKGFGFIQGEDGKEYFFHYSGLVNGEFSSLTEGQKVTFEATKSAKGPRAESVEIL